MGLHGQRSRLAPALDVTLGLTGGDQFLTVFFPDPGAGFTIVDASVLDTGTGIGNEILIAIYDPANPLDITAFGVSAAKFGWTIAIDTTTPPTKLSPTVYRYKLIVTLGTVTKSTVGVQYQFVTRHLAEGRRRPRR